MSGEEESHRRFRVRVRVLVLVLVLGRGMVLYVYPLHSLFPSPQMSFLVTDISSSRGSIDSRTSSASSSSSNSVIDSLPAIPALRPYSRSHFGASNGSKGRGVRMKLSGYVISTMCSALGLANLGPSDDDDEGDSNGDEDGCVDVRSG